MTGRPVVVEFDDYPLTLRAPTGGDYLSRFLVSASSRSAVELADISADGRRQHYRVRPGARFSDGSPVRAEQVLRTLRAALRVPAWQRYLICLTEIHAAGDQLELRLDEPADYLPALLATADFAPAQEDPVVSCGPYLPAVCVDEHEYLLRPSGLVPAAAPLLIRVERDASGAPDRHRAGLTDVTCSTAFPLERLAELREHPGYRTAPTGIQFRLEPVPCADSPVGQPAFRRWLAIALDRAALCQAMAGGMRPSQPWEFRNETAVTTRGIQLTLGYHEYNPNRKVAELVAAQLGGYGIRVEPRAVDYASGDATGVDLLLALRCAPFDHPYARFEQYDPGRSILVAELDRLRSPGDRPGAERAVRERLAELVPAVPLMELDGHWLCRPGVEFCWPPAERCYLDPPC